MNRMLYFVRALFGVCVFALLATPLHAEPSEKNIISRTAEIDGVQLHYLTAGHGPTVILLHGYAETSRMWRPIIPVLAEKFTVIAPDLPGIGDSAIPADKIDMKTSAIRIHGLARSLGAEKARVVGHDIGLMVAYAYATQFPAETEKLVVMDAFLPGVAGWEAIYNAPNISGTFLPLTRTGPFRKRIGKRTQKRTRNRAACAQRGLISPPGRNSPRSSRNSPKRN